ncbi:MAG: DUF3560 domain-containing protein [Candidatus Odinarchaeota archaeon]
MSTTQTKEIDTKKKTYQTKLRDGLINPDPKLAKKLAGMNVNDLQLMLWDKTLLNADKYVRSRQAKIPNGVLDNYEDTRLAPINYIPLDKLSKEELITLILWKREKKRINREKRKRERDQEKAKLPEQQKQVDEILTVIQVRTENDRTVTGIEHLPEIQSYQNYYLMTNSRDVYDYTSSLESIKKKLLQKISFFYDNKEKIVIIAARDGDEARKFYKWIDTDSYAVYGVEREDREIWKVLKYDYGMDFDKDEVAWRGKLKPVHAEKVADFLKSYSLTIVEFEEFTEEEQDRQRREKLFNRGMKRKEWAESRERKATERRQYSDDLVKNIPFGQPILVGHHSEKAHRNRLEKSRNAMFKMLEHKAMSEEHENKSETLLSRAATPKGSARRKRELREEAINNYLEINDTVTHGWNPDLRCPLIVVKKLKRSLKVKDSDGTIYNILKEDVRFTAETIEKMKQRKQDKEEHGELEQPETTGKKTGFYKGIDLHDWQLEINRKLQELETIENPETRLKAISSLEKEAWKFRDSNWVTAGTTRRIASAKVAARDQLEEIQSKEKAEIREQVKEEEMKEKEKRTSKLAILKADIENARNREERENILKYFSSDKKQKISELWEKILALEKFTQDKLVLEKQDIEWIDKEIREIDETIAEIKKEN